MMPQTQKAHASKWFSHMQQPGMLFPQMLAPQLLI